MQSTSLQAYNKVPITTRQKQIVDVFKENPHLHNWTNQELADYLDWGVNRVTGRVKELREKGVLEYSETRPCESTENTAKAWRLKIAQKIRDNLNKRPSKKSYRTR